MDLESGAAITAAICYQQMLSAGALTLEELEEAPRRGPVVHRRDDWKHGIYSFLLSYDQDSCRRTFGCTREEFDLLFDFLGLNENALGPMDLARQKEKLAATLHWLRHYPTDLDGARESRVGCLSLA